MVFSTGEPFCNPSCEVDNGGCGDDECIEGHEECVGPDEPCFRFVICFPHPPIPGMAELKITIIYCAMLVHLTIASTSMCIQS